MQWFKLVYNKLKADKSGWEQSREKDCSFSSIDDMFDFLESLIESKEPKISMPKLESERYTITADHSGGKSVRFYIRKK